MSSTQLTNSDLSEPKEEILVTQEEKESTESDVSSTLNTQDQEVQSEDKQKDKVLESGTIVEEHDQPEDKLVVIKEEENDVNNHNLPNDKVSNQKELDNNENSTSNIVNTNEIEQISVENNDPSMVSHWSAVWDDNAQAYYYWNTVTNETTWENPENKNLMVQPVNSEYSEHDYYYYSQYGYYPEYYYGYDHSALVTPSSTTTATTTEPSTNPLDSILDKIDKEVKTKLDGNSSKAKKSSSTFDSRYNDNQDQQQHEQDEQHEKHEKVDKTSLISSSTDLDSYYDQNQMTTNDAEYQSFLAEHGGNGGDYTLTARFNAKTGKFQRDPTMNPEKFSADSKAIRQMSYFFDYDQFAESRGSSASNKRLSSDGDSIRSPKKLNKKDIEMFKQKKKEKKDMKKKSWLLSDD
ncbi:hypothetical protein C1645_278459 [Glomus cerebriforme]|uniref:WW domain-containing protein n=1 Tax=Glomus cerebriforme TaxID=658196 RepID=A0A397TRN7_9GLOM|nr:hypothetical protein C1645_278459 [Glomus cerebriforme]